MDSRVLAAERAAAQGEPGARERLILERMRAGAPDPRVDPTPGAEVLALGRYTGRGSSRVARQVTRLWPGRLVTAAPVVAAAGWDDTRSPITWLRVGAPVLSVFPLSTEVRDGERRTVTWDVVAKTHDGGEWVRVVTAEEPDVEDSTRFREADAPQWRAAWPTLPVEVVEWYHAAKNTGRRQRSTLAQWRKWAKGGTVLHLGRGA
jgi:hypothetical protein